VPEIENIKEAVDIGIKIDNTVRDNNVKIR